MSFKPMVTEKWGDVEADDEQKVMSESGWSATSGESSQRRWGNTEADEEHKVRSNSSWSVSVEQINVASKIAEDNVMRLVPASRIVEVRDIEGSYLLSDMNRDRLYKMYREHLNEKLTEDKDLNEDVVLSIYGFCDFISDLRYQTSELCDVVPITCYADSYTNVVPLMNLDISESFYMDEFRMADCTYINSYRYGACVLFKSKIYINKTSTAEVILSRGWKGNDKQMKITSFKLFHRIIRFIANESLGAVSYVNENKGKIEVFSSKMSLLFANKQHVNELVEMEEKVTGNIVFGFAFNEWSRIIKDWSGDIDELLNVRLPSPSIDGTVMVSSRSKILDLLRDFRFLSKCVTSKLRC